MISLLLLYEGAIVLSSYSKDGDTNVPSGTYQRERIFCLISLDKKQSLVQ